MKKKREERREREEEEEDKDGENTEMLKLTLRAIMSQKITI